MLPFDPVQADATPLDSDKLVSIAEKTAPGARVTVIQLAGNPKAPVRIIMKYPEDHTPAGRTNLFLDAYTGKVRQLTDSRSAPLGFKLAGAPLAVVDGLMAATALHYNLILVTRNIKDVQVAGINTLNPWQL